jgi:hypothetical protein
VNRHLRAIADLRGLSTRLDDVLTNQAAITYALASTDLTAFSTPCADNPLSSRSCRHADCGSEYADWLGSLGIPPVVSRKEWEHVAIWRALDAAGQLAPGKRALGFGVGREPLVAAFAAKGVDVVATDLPVTDSRATHWLSTAQYSLESADLRNPRLCPDEAFSERVSVRPVDMNAIPDDLVGFDVVWSACAFEHLGSIEAGLSFVERAMECLAPGGIAVHTTEFNLDSDEDTLEKGPTVVYRQRDLDELRQRLALKGHAMSPFAVGAKTGVFDYLIDTPPYHFGSLIVRLGKHRITSAVLVVQAGNNRP